MYSFFLPSSLLNARFHFHLISFIFFVFKINDIISKCELVFFSHFKINVTKMRVCGDDADCFWLI